MGIGSLDLVQTIREWAPERLAITHFGGYDDVTAQLDDLERRLDAWSRLARDEGRDEFIATIREELLRGGSSEQIATYQQAAPAEQLYLGYERYWSKRAAA